MTVHNIYIFDRTGSLVHYAEWARKKPATMSMEEEGKLVYGMLFSLRSFLEKISPLDVKDNSFSYRTTKYKLNYYEAPTGVKIVLNTDLAANPAPLINNIYSQVWVEYVAKNPLTVPGQYINSELFSVKLDSLVKSSSIYSNRNV